MIHIEGHIEGCEVLRIEGESPGFAPWGSVRNSPNPWMRDRPISVILCLPRRRFALQHSLNPPRPPPPPPLPPPPPPAAAAVAP